MTAEEILRQSGITDDQIKALDPKMITAFSGVLTQAEKERATAQAAREAAELAQRSNVDFYENRIAPSLTQWEEEKSRIENEKARAAAEAAFYRTQAEEAKKGGFIATDAPGFDPSKFTPPNPQPRDASGKYVANAPGSTPGSPTYINVEQIAQRAGDAMGIIADLQWEHQRLYGQPLPISPTELIKQADSVKLDPRTYASRTFNWDVRRQQMADEEKKAEREKIAAEAVAPVRKELEEERARAKKELADREREIYERVGSNPDVRRPQASPHMTEIAKAAKENPNLDPLNMNDQQRRAVTAQMIRKDIEANQQA